MRVWEMKKKKNKGKKKKTSKTVIVRCMTV